MEIIAENIGKKFNKEWIFRNLTFAIQEKESLAITGANGSGKSTLMQILAGSIPSTEGNIIYQSKKYRFSNEDFFKQLSFASPYLELIEEMTITELVNFHTNFKPIIHKTTEEFIYQIQLPHAANKEIRFLSSGMKQRVKLGLAIFSESPILMLDEPTTNLDSNGIEWYREEILKQINNRIIIICSNQRYEYDFCEKEITIKK